ncbi:DUF4124 domain-containing protein [Alishewanella tabrizica]|nr:DUF4124 domain-containing protein [Alishewanella tabrizica]
MAKVQLLLLFVVGFASNASLSAQTVYSWQDSKGVTHFSQQPPPNGDYQLLSVQSSRAATPREAEAGTVGDTVDPALCQQAKNQLELLKNQQELFTRVLNTTTNTTEMRLITDDEREQQRLLAEFEIKRRCSATP